jgi:hypothetical protein
MMLGYGRYLMAKTALLLMLMMMMMTGAMPGAAYSVTVGEAKTDDFQQAYGRVRPGTKESGSRISSSGDPTKCKQALKVPPPIGQLLG